MRKLLTLLLLLMLLLTSSAMAAEKSAYRLADEQGTLLAWLDVPPAVGDVLLTADGTRHRVIAVQGRRRSCARMARRRCPTCRGLPARRRSP